MQMIEIGNHRSIWEYDKFGLERVALKEPVGYPCRNSIQASWKGFCNGFNRRTGVEDLRVICMDVLNEALRKGEIILASIYCDKWSKGTHYTIRQGTKADLLTGIIWLCGDYG